MGLRDAWAALRGTSAPAVEYRDAGGWASFDPSTLTVDQLWRSQPHLRTVVTFLARNIAQLGLHAFQRVSTTDRVRLDSGSDPLVALLSRPNDHATMFSIVYRLVADRALHDEAFIIPSEGPDGWTLESIPASWVVQRGGTSPLYPDWFEFQTPGNKKFKLDRTDLLWFGGYDPSSMKHGSSPINSLKAILAEQIEAQGYRRQVWARAGRVGGYLTRPVGARWDPDTREQFKRDWTAKFSGDGPQAGGTPILEDGMEFKRPGFSAHEEEWVEGTKLAFATVASAYHVNPTMVGLLDNANFSNVREFRRMLYGDTLGPIIADIEAVLNQFLVPKVSTTPRSYVEFNIAEKMQGSFEEQTQALQSSIGRPWMTANEGRAVMNLPALDGDADELVTPLNVITGGQASPNDTDTSQLASAVVSSYRAVSLGELQVRQPQVRAKSDTPTEEWSPKYQELLAKFYARQGATVIRRMGAKAPSWWDEDRWNEELAADLLKVSLAAGLSVVHGAARDNGFDPDDYPAERMTPYLKVAMAARARVLNDTTLDQLEAEGADPAQVFTTAENSRSISGAGALAAAVTSWAVVEFAKAYLPGGATKTWVTGSDPRPSHAAMSGETVGIDDTFSNGARWPGDPALGVDEVAGCNCGLETSF